MPRYYPGPLGTPIGKLEGMVIRRVNGKTFYSTRPDTYKMSQAKSAKDSRQAFGLVARFAKIISASPVLSNCWKKSKLKGTSAYHRIIKHNLPLTKEGLLTKKNGITPDGFGYNINTSIGKTYDLLFNLDLTRSGIGDTVKNVNVYCIIVFSNPNRRSKPADFLEASISFEEVKTKDILEFELKYPKREKELFNKYNRLILFTAVSFNNTNEKVSCSGSAAQEFRVSKKKTRTFESA